MKNKKIQLIRAVLAIAVIMIHVMPVNSIEAKIYVRPLLNIAVAGFIYLSGYLTRTEIDVKKFYKKRIPTALFPYILFTVFYTVLGNYEHGIAGVGKAIIENLLTTQGKMTLYYLVVYIQLVLLTPLLARIAKQKNRVLNIVILAIQPLFILCFYLGVIKGDIFSTAPWYMMFFPTWVLYYYLGILIGNNLINIKTSNKILIIAAVGGIASQIMEGLFWLNNTPVKDMYYSQIRFTTLLENIPILLLMTRYIRSPREKCNKLLCEIGDASFGIYLLHPAFIMVCDKILVRTEVTFTITFVTAFVGSFATVLILNKIIPRKALKYAGLAIK